MSLTPEEIAAETKRFEEWQDAFLEELYVYPAARVAWLAGVASERERLRQELPRLIQQYAEHECLGDIYGDEARAAEKILAKINAILGVK